MSRSDLTRLDRLVLNAIQSDFPVESRPYEALARRLNAEHGLSLNGDEVWNAIKQLRTKGFIRRLGAVFNAAPLEYRSNLCAAKVPEDKMEKFAALVNSSPKVTHNYLRSDDFNVWFTFSAHKPDELSNFVDFLKTESGVEEIYALEAEKRFKIKVNFTFSQAGD